MEEYLDFWSSRKILVAGSRWSISNGNSVQIWNDAWLRGPGDGKIVSPNKGLSADTKVNILIDPITRSWRKDLISEFFHPFDVEKVLNTRISLSNKDDSLN